MRLGGTSSNVPHGASRHGARSGACTTDTTFEDDCVWIPGGARFDGTTQAQRGGLQGR